MTPIPTPRAVLDLIDTSPLGVLIIDGRSGAGKTSLAAILAPMLGARVLHMDDLYRGWEGLVEAPDHLANALRIHEYRRYDWSTGELEETHTLNPATPLIIEGCGSLTSDTLDAARAFTEAGAVRSLWIDCPTQERKERALARDGEMFRPHWETWAEQEEQILAEQHSRDLADVRITSTDRQVLTTHQIPKVPEVATE